MYRALTLGIAIMAVPLAADDAVRLHPLEAYWVKYKFDGFMQGEVIEQCRNWCNERAETRKLTLSMAGIDQIQNNRSVTVKDVIYNVDLDSGQVTKMTNPMYDSMVEQVRTHGVDATFEAWMTTFGFTPTGQTLTIAGESCIEYSNPQMMGSTSCVTNDGITLRSEVGQAVQTALEVHRGDAGDAAAFVIPEGAAEQPAAPAGIPNMEELQELLKQYQGAQPGQ